MFVSHGNQSTGPLGSNNKWNSESAAIRLPMGALSVGLQQCQESEDASSWRLLIYCFFFMVFLRGANWGGGGYPYVFQALKALLRAYPWLILSWDIPSPPWPPLSASFQLVVWIGGLVVKWSGFPFPLYKSQGVKNPNPTQTKPSLQFGSYLTSLVPGSWDSPCPWPPVGSSGASFARRRSPATAASSRCARGIPRPGSWWLKAAREGHRSG